MAITFLGGWFEIFRSKVNFLSPTLLAVEWEVRFAHFLYQKIFKAKKLPIFKHFFLSKFQHIMEKYLEKGRFLGDFFFTNSWPHMKKSPKKADFSADFFSSKFWPSKGKYLKKPIFFRNFFRILSHGFLEISFFKKKKPKRRIFLKMTGEDNKKSFQK